MPATRLLLKRSLLAALGSLHFRLLYRPLISLWTILFSTVVLALIGDCTTSLVLEGELCSLTPAVLEWVFGIWLPLVAIAVLLAVATLLSHVDRLQNGKRERLGVVKSASELEPEDFGFRRLDRRESTSAHGRPFHPSYIPRKLAPRRSRTQGRNARGMSEDEVRDLLASGRGIVVVGQPLDGKTRTLYELVRGLDDHEVIMPDERQAPGQSDFSVIEDQRVVVVLNDLTRFAVPSGLDLRKFCARAQEYARSLAVLASCRDGAELSSVRQSVGNGLRHFYEEIPRELILLPLNGEEKETLTRLLGVRSDRYGGAFTPTPGFIAMAGELGAMSTRFSDLEDRSPQACDVLRVLRLLAAHGVVPFTHNRLRWVLESDGLFARRGLHLPDCLRELNAQSFISSGDGDPVEPEHGYLLHVVSYSESKEAQDDTEVLARVLEQRSDAEGLLYLAASLTLDSHEEALPYFDCVLALRPDYPEAWLNKGVSLYKLDRHREALVAQETALRHRPNYPDALVNKANALDGLARYDEALDVIEGVLVLRPRFAEALITKAVVLDNMGRYSEALTAAEQAFDISPDSAHALASRANALQHTGRLTEAVRTYDQVIGYCPEEDGLLIGALVGRGNALDRLGEPYEALESYDEALDIDPANRHALYNKGVALYHLEESSQALELFDRVLGETPHDVWSCLFKGLSLLELGSFDEARPWLCKAWGTADTGASAEADRVLRAAGFDPWRSCEN